MIVIKVFAAGENRELRIEEALFRFIFPAEPAPKKGLGSCSHNAERRPPAEKTEMGNRELGKREWP